MIAFHEMNMAEAMGGADASLAPAVAHAESLESLETLASLDALPGFTETAEAIEHAMDPAANVMPQPELPDEPEPAPATPASSEPAVMDTFDMVEAAAMAMPMSEPAPAYAIPPPVEIEATSAPAGEAPASANEPEIAPAMVSTSEPDQANALATAEATALVPSLTNSQIAAAAPTPTEVEDVVALEGAVPGPMHDERSASMMVPVLVEDSAVPLTQASLTPDTKPMRTTASAMVAAPCQAVAPASPPATASPPFAMALKFAERGIGVFPLWGFKGANCACGEPVGSRYCRPGKHPRQLASFKGASISATIIKSWFTHYGPLNYGIATGREIADSGMMIVVVDIDAYKLEGQMTLEALEREGHMFPETAEVLTGRGGRHLYYLVKCGTVFEQTAGPGIDLKGIGGYVVGPGSMHATGRPYEWEASSDLFDGQEIADMPQWMYDKFAKKAPVAVSPQQIALPASMAGDEVTDAQVAEYKCDLDVIPADQYHIWLDVLMALKSRSPCEKMFALADWWSQKSRAYNGVEDVRHKWDQIKSEGNITIKSLKRLSDMQRAKGVDISRLVAAPVQQPEDESIDWPEPEPIASSAPTREYPLDALPIIMREAVEEVQAYAMAPMALVACSALSSLSLAAQGLYDVQRDVGLTGPISLYMLAIAESGERKTTLDTFFIKPAREFEEASLIAAQPEILKFNTDMQAWGAKGKGILEKITQNAREAKDNSVQELALALHDAAKPVAPVVPRVVYGDATPEALTRGLGSEWPSGGVISSEGGAVFGGHGMGKESQMRNLAVLNELWDGKPIRIDRRTSASYTVNGARLTVAVQVQPATLGAFMEGSGPLARGSGFIARFLTCFPESTQGTRAYKKSPPNWPQLDRFRNRIADLFSTNPVIEDGALKPAMLYLTDKAMSVWIDFYNEIEIQLGISGVLRDVRDVASKTADNAVRIAALFHVLAGEAGSISEIHMRNGARVAKWHLNESQRVFVGGIASAGYSDAQKLEDWLVAYCEDNGVVEVPVKIISQYGPSALRKKPAHTPVLDELERLGRVKVGAAPARTVHLNPALLS